MSFLKNYPQIQIVQSIAKKKNVAVFLVGGFLRDFLLGRPCLDFDFAVEKDAVKLARLFAKRIHGAFVLLDEEHGCARVAKKEKGVLRTFDFADFRAPSFPKDLLHRDFTINTFSLDIVSLSSGTKVEDALMDIRKGRGDLKAKRICMVSHKAFREDPLRLLRAFSLRAMLGFTIEKETLNRIKKDKDLIRDVSAERVRDELFKIFKSENAAVNLKEMDRIGLLEKVLPQIAVMYGVKQGTYHHLDVWPHSLEAVAQFEKLLEALKQEMDVFSYLNECLAGQRTRGALIKLAAILHDVGKPAARKKEPGKISFHGHERVGKSIVKSLAKALKLSTKERFALQDMVFWHLRPGYLSNFKKPSEKAIYRYFRDTDEEAVSVALLSLADQRATRGPLTTEEDQKHHEKICLNLVERFFEKKKEKPFIRLINGDTLIKELKLKPSPLFAKILDQIEEQQVTGKIKTKKEAVELAKKIASKKAK